MQIFTVDERHRIVIVGGGAGGLELATRLGNTLGRRNKAIVTLLDYSPTHVWKPLLHEVAAGTLEPLDEALEYLGHSADNHYRFFPGRMNGLDRGKKEIRLESVLNEKGEEIVSGQCIGYDTLVMAVGSLSNDFGIKGVAEHCLFIDTQAEAEQFHRQFMEAYLRAQNQPKSSQRLEIVIVGGGATGIELSAELHRIVQALCEINAYRYDGGRPAEVGICIIEAAERLLPGLPPYLSAATSRQLEKLGIAVLTGERVLEVTREGLKTGKIPHVPAHIKVWAAGVKAPAFLLELDGLETNAINQLIVRRTLQTSLDDNIFVIGDCAACPQPHSNRNVPPTAQAAHQEASLTYTNILRRLHGKKLLEYSYRDYGCLVTFGKYSTVGTLMGNLLGQVFIEGFMARLVYLSLYKMHQAALFGAFRTALLAVVDTFTHGSWLNYGKIDARCARAPRGFASGPGYPLYAIMDAIVDQYSPVLLDFQLRLERIEADIFASRFNHETLVKLYELKREMLLLQTAAVPLLDICNALT
ncbi:FAD-dependent oxidoreductase [Candidatus Methylospira mobilis]|uniref:FAD-dependent oxidoreductase n=1 Tax=Candidatus Methylospira mobilis TaxID=1808979 RepID=A0A5Q0BKI6_9GAMM|nr:FAD-dependent oxidoreductase [Candidatus Methylospira mobilis]QFY44435.1 FAD-dependent oxidoreductase [Candidatus Methylospira mobilis]